MYLFFVITDEEDSIFKAKGGLAELQKRILMIKQCLKDQYILYRDYSSLAQTVNSKYIPASLEDAKKVYVSFIFLCLYKKEKNSEVPIRVISTQNLLFTIKLKYTIPLR